MALKPNPGIRLPDDDIVTQKTNGFGGILNDGQIQTNSLKFDVLKPIHLFKYRVKFSPELPSPKRRLQVVQQFLGKIATKFLFDDIENALYVTLDIEVALAPLGQVMKFQSSDNSESSSFLLGNTTYIDDCEVTLTFHAITAPKFVVQLKQTFFTVLFRTALRFLGLSRHNDVFYDTVSTIPKCRIAIQPGIQVGSRENDSGSMFWLETSALVWRTKSILSSLHEMKQMTLEGFEIQFEKLILHHFIFSPTRTQSYFEVDVVRWDLSPLTTFQVSGQWKNFVDYYFEQYGIKIKDMSQPLLITKMKHRNINQSYEIYHCQDPFIASSSENLVVHIPELCYLSGLRMESKHDDGLSREIKKYVNLSPKEIMATMNNLLDRINGSKACQELFQEWDVKLHSAFLFLQSRVLAGPKLIFNSSTSLDFGIKETFLNAQTDFMKLAGSTPVYSAVLFHHSILVCSTEDETLAKVFKDVFTTEARKLGVAYPGVHLDVKIVLVKNNHEKALDENFVTAIRKAGQTQLLVVIIPRRSDGNVYRSVKKLCLLELGIPSQAIRAKSIECKGHVGILQKVTLQINCKLGGALWSLDTNSLETEAIMTVGIDTYHDRMKRNDSVFAAVFTLNSECTKYYTRTVFQAVGQETGDGLVTLFTDALFEFYKECKRWPSKVVVYRDGVSNFYLPIIQAHEIVQIQRSLNLISPKPKLVVVLIQKHTTDRFMLMHSEGVMNPMPGTVVDHTITRTEYQDFYLVSQMLRGTGSGQPTRCIVLTDETNDFNSVQAATFAASFTYFNWHGSVRIPGVCQYAHKAAGLVGSVLKKEPLPRMERQLYYL